MKVEDAFEVKATDLGGRIGCLMTKTCTVETPALLPVIHPVRQIISCQEIRTLGYEAVMTNAYTTYRQLHERSEEGIHKIIGFDGMVMTDSGGYQVLQYGSVDIQPEEMARFEENIGSDIAIVLDKPTGLDVTKEFAKLTVTETIAAAERTAKVISKDDVIWTLPIQGGRYLDLVTRSARASAKLDFGCYALGSPVEVMEEYDFALLVRMIVAAKKELPQNRPFHLFGAGHPLILPLAVCLGCDMFDSASYMLYAKQDRYISPVGTVRLEQLEYLGCTCKTCGSFSARELRSLPKEDRIAELARHNLAILKQVIEETKQAIWEGRLWEYVQSKTRNHPRAQEAFHVAISCGERNREILEIGTPAFKDRGLFNFDKIDLSRPEMHRHRSKIKSLDLSQRKALFILPETKTKPFLKSKIFEEVTRIGRGKLDRVLIATLCPNFGLVPSEISDIYPLSQCTNALYEFPSDDAVLNLKKWDTIVILQQPEDKVEEGWLRSEMAHYLKVDGKKRNVSRKERKKSSLSRVKKTELKVARSYREFKQFVRESISSID